MVSNRFELCTGATWVDILRLVRIGHCLGVNVLGLTALLDTQGLLDYSSR